MMRKVSIRYYEGLFGWRKRLYKKLQAKLFEMDGPLCLVKRSLPLVTMGHLTRGLINDLVNIFIKDDGPVSSLSIHGSSWRDGMSLDPRVNVVVGHSFGAYRALQAATNAEQDIELLILFDVRWFFGRKFRKSANVKKCLNFYQTGLLRGFKVDGAEDVEIFGSSHGGITNDLAAIGRIINEIFER